MACPRSRSTPRGAGRCRSHGAAESTEKCATETQRTRRTSGNNTLKTLGTTKYDSWSIWTDSAVGLLRDDPGRSIRIVSRGSANRHAEVRQCRWRRAVLTFQQTHCASQRLLIDLAFAALLPVDSERRSWVGSLGSGDFPVRAQIGRVHACDYRPAAVGLRTGYYLAVHDDNSKRSAVAFLFARFSGRSSRLRRCEDTPKAFSESVHGAHRIIGGHVYHV